jgi:hypothetical protein
MYIFKRTYLAGILAVVGIVSWTLVPVAAASSTRSTTQNVIQSYNASSSVLTSMLVEYAPKSQTTVIPLKSSDIQGMIGVVVPTSNATLYLASQNTTTQEVLVAPSGHYYALVSDQNGVIKSGDYLTASSVPGVAMLATSSQPLIIGRADAGFSGTNPISEVQLRTSQNSNIKDAIGRIPANIQLAPNPLYLKNSNSILVFLTRAEYNVTNKPISPVRTYVSALLLLITVLTTVVILYTGTRTAMLSVGRNPLAKPEINKTLYKTIIGGLIVFAVGLVVVYLILNK